MRLPIMAGNWKMYKTPAETAAFFEAFKPLVAEASHCEVVICPPFTHIPVAIEHCSGTSIAVGAQNLHWGKEGAMTGEISGYMLQALGCRYVVVAHSERRQYFGETGEDALRKAQAAIEYGLTPIVCVGERLDERESGMTREVLEGQFASGIAPLTPEQFAKVVIAYEPVWAIGTNLSATPEMAADAHRCLRAQAAAKFGDEAAQGLRILYGGSVKPGNVASLMAEEEIDGALVGGASLDPRSFASIVHF